VAEVLDRQTPGVREFLLRTSIATRLTGSLCDALLDRTDSARRLVVLERANLFLISLDERRHVEAEVRAAERGTLPGPLADGSSSSPPAPRWSGPRRGCCSATWARRRKARRSPPSWSPTRQRCGDRT
jgi:hypothetical protein